MKEGNQNSPLLTFSENLATAVEKVAPAIVAVDARPRVATSGVMWRDGVIVSTSHTVRRDEEITVALGDGQRLPAKLVGRDPSTDLAVLRLETDDQSGVDAIITKDDNLLKVGNVALAVGRVHGDGGVTAAFGTISFLGSKWLTWRGGEMGRLIQPDVSIFIGFSGGALIDVEGRVIGINTTGLARGGALTIPVSTVNLVVDAILKHGGIPRPYLGITMQPVTLPDELRSKLSLMQERGVVVLSVEAQSPAGAAGIVLGDVLLVLNDAPLDDTDDVQALLNRSQVGQAMRATILRGGEQRDMTITLGERPQRKEGTDDESRHRWRRSRRR